MNTRGSRATIEILLVEDNDGDARLIEELLGEVHTFDAHVVRATRIKGAIEQLRESAFDVVLLDLTLPDARGIDCVAKLHAVSSSAPIVVLTGVDDENLALDAMGVGAEDYLVKGQASGAMIARAVRYAIQRKRAEDNLKRLVHEQVARAQAEASERRARFLAELGRGLAMTLDWDATLSSAAKAVVPTLADIAMVDVLDDGGEIQRVASAAAYPNEVALASALMEFAPRYDSESDPISRAMRTATPVMVSEVASASDLGFSRGAPHDALVRRIEPRSVLVLPLVARGRTLGTLTLAHTLSGRRFTPDELPFADEVATRIALAVDNAKLLRGREDMLSVVSHDLRNPLNVIGFVTASLKRSAVTEEQKQGYVAKLRRAADRMNRLIQDLLDVSRMEGGILPVERTVQPAAPIVAEVLEMMRPLAEEKKLFITGEADHGLPMLAVDRERVLQIFSNLVGNAIKFTPAGGAITVSAHADGSDVHFVVADSGPGIAKENLVRVFDRFWQAKRQDRQGAGLGLAIAKGLVFAHDGRIWAESVEGEGSTFHVVLPATPQGAVRAKVTSAEADAGAP